MAGDNPGKRKGGDDRDRAGDVKKSKGGSGGKWATPHFQAKADAPRRGGKIEPGDAGIWCTVIKGKEGKATVELQAMFEDCAHRYYGLGSGQGGDEDVGDDDEDISAAISREAAALGDESERKLFKPVFLDIMCVLFFKTNASIDPVDFVKRICEEVEANSSVRRMRFANRLTPVVAIEKANEKGLEEVGKKVLSAFFNMKALDVTEAFVGERKGVVDEAKENTDESVARLHDHSYAIRPTTRNHSHLKRDAVIKQIATSISDTHKVNLTTPDKVIIVEIYQTVVGMSVVGPEWERLKRFNLFELYKQHDLEVEAQHRSKELPIQVAELE